MEILVTGATGFVGKALVSKFVDIGWSVKALVRQASDLLPESIVQVVGDLSCFCPSERNEESVECAQSRVENLHLVQDDRKLLRVALKDADVVVHAAARAHIMRNEALDPLTEYRKMNRDATLVLARMAAELGVKRFVFMSSIGVNGKLNTKPFTEADRVSPHDAYSISKFEAEQGLLELANETGMEVVIIRPPLVYGKNAPGNFGILVKWISKGIPLPLGAVHNRRSLVALDNLVDFITLCADRTRSPLAVNQVFMISDGDDISTTELLRKVAKAQGKMCWLLPIPVGLMKRAMQLLGKGAMADRLFGSLQVDNSKARELLGWTPVVTMDEQLARMNKDNK